MPGSTTTSRNMAHSFETTLLVPNLHCQTCAQYIEALVGDLRPPSTVKSLSIVDHSATLLHDRTLLAASIVKAFSSAGYEVFDVILDPASEERLEIRDSEKSHLEAAIERWHPARSEVDEKSRIQHTMHCDMCAQHSEKTAHPELESVAVGSGDSTSFASKHVATMSIDGMTCSSCVGNVEGALNGLPSVSRAEVSLLSHSATVHFEAQDAAGKAKQLVEAVEDAGYDADIIEVKNDVQNSAGCRDAERATRTISLSIKGMHCSHCPARIQKALSEIPVHVEKAATLDNPVTTISYEPNAPQLTIRTIINHISAIDGNFAVSVHHPPSVEERSKKMLARERRGILARVVLCLLTAIPTLIIGVVYMSLVPKTGSGSRYLATPIHGVSRAEWAVFIMSTMVYFFATDHFHRRTLKELHALWRPGSTTPILKRLYRFGSMNMLITLGTTVAYFSSLAQLITAASNPSRATMRGSGQSYFDSVVFLTAFLLVGRLAEAHMKAKAGDAVAELGRLRPKEALLVEEAKESGTSKAQHVSIDLVDIGDTVKVVHGATPPCDGTLLDDSADFDESSLSGESRLVRKVSGDPVYSGTINKGKAVSLKVTAPAGASMLDSIIQVVREGQAKRAPVERVADLLTAYFVPIIVLLAIVTWVVWLALGLSGVLPSTYLDNKSGGWPFWSLQFAIAVFVIACPCGIGLAAPTALFVGGGMAAKRGILVKGGGESFQEASGLDCIVFDKTGTLTEGAEPRIVDSAVNTDVAVLESDTIWAALKAVEENSNHPLAKASVAFAASRTDKTVTVSSADEVPGRGIKASITLMNEGSPTQYEVLVGSESLMNDNGVQVPDDLRESLESWKATACSVIVMACRTSDLASGEWQVVSVLAAADSIREEAADVVAALQLRNIDVWMLSGDNPTTANAIGQRLNIPTTNIIAGVLPAEKAEKIRYLQKSLPASRRGALGLLAKQRNRATVAMVGDGINDAPALAAADVGFAVASGSDVAVQSASFVLMHSDLRAVLTLVNLSRAVFRRVLLNFFWAAIYNIIALPIAAGVLYPIHTSGNGHVRLGAAWAALAMALSSVSVVGSSLLLRTRLPLVGFREK